MNTTTKVRIGIQDRHVGIDVGKSMLDIFIYETELHWQVENTPEGIKLLVRSLKRYKLTRVLVEATGGYERAVAEACSAAGLPIIVVTPLRIRQFAKAQGLMAKTDKIDAKLIGQFGAKMQPEVRQLPDIKTRLFKDLVARKRQLNETRTQELNRFQKAQSHVKPSHKRMLKILDKEIEWVNVKLKKEIERIDEWKRIYKILLSAPGIGDGVAFTLLAELPELGCIFWPKPITHSEKSRSLILEKPDH